MTTESTEHGDDGKVGVSAAEPAVLEPASSSTRRSFPQPLLIAAAVIAVVAIGAGVFALTRGDDDSQKVGTEAEGGFTTAGNVIWNSTWELVALERAGEPWDVEPHGETWPQLTTTQPGAKAIGYQACNQGTGTATVEGDRLVITEFFMTVAGCLSEDGSTTLMDQEVFVTDLLGDRPTIAIETYDVETDGETDDGFDGHGIGDRLTLTTTKGSATFERTSIGSAIDDPPIGGPIDGGTDGAGPQALWGRMWDVKAIDAPGQLSFVVGNVPTGSTVRLDASTPGQLSFNGCNGAGGTFDLDGDHLVLKEVAPGTLMGCEQALMDQDARLQAFLEAGPTVAIDGNHLTLTAGESTVELEAAEVVVGRPIDPADPADPDGTVSSPPQPPGSDVGPEG